MQHRKRKRRGSNVISRLVCKELAIANEMFPLAEAKRVKQSVKQTRVATCIPVSVADLRSFVDRFFAVPADRHQGYVLTTPNDIEHESSLIMMTTPALAPNVQRCKETWGVVWLGRNDNDGILE